MRKKLLTLTMAITMMATVTACGNDDAKQSKKGNFGGNNRQEITEEAVCIIPEGGEYKVYATGKVLGVGDEMPIMAEKGDRYSYGEYKYRMQEDGWEVELEMSDDNYNKTSFGEILGSIAGAPIVDVSGLFARCASMIESPVIPLTVTEAFKSH